MTRKKIKCYECEGYGHRAFECATRKIRLKQKVQKSQDEDITASRTKENKGESGVDISKMEQYSETSDKEGKYQSKDDTSILVLPIETKINLALEADYKLALDDVNRIKGVVIKLLKY